VFERLSKSTQSVNSGPAYKRKPRGRTSRPRIKKVEERPRSRLQVQSHTQQPKRLQVCPAIWVQLSGSNIQQTQDSHGELVKWKSDVEL